MSPRVATLDPAATQAWAAAVPGALRALRLNKHFPPWAPFSAWSTTIAADPPMTLDRASGLPVPRSWMRVRTERASAAQRMADLAHLSLDALPEADRTRLAKLRARLTALQALPDLPLRSMRVALRHDDGTIARYQIVLDRFDAATATFARYTILAADQRGRTVSAGDLALEAHDRFKRQMSALGTQDAALAFAALEAGGMQVEEVVRGVIGPALAPGHRCGPPSLHNLIEGHVMSACLERVSRTLQQGRVDDPIAQHVTVPGTGADFGLAWHRKWAVPRDQVARMRAWLAEQGSRNIVYGY